MNAALFLVHTVIDLVILCGVVFVALLVLLFLARIASYYIWHE